MEPIRILEFSSCASSPKQLRPGWCTTYINIWWYKFGGKVWILCPKVNVYSQWTGQIPTNKPCGLRSSHPHPLLWDEKVDVYPSTHSKPPKKAQHLCNIQWLCVCVYIYIYYMCVSSKNMCVYKKKQAPKRSRDIALKQWQSTKDIYTIYLKVTLYIYIYIYDPSYIITYTYIHTHIWYG